MKYNRRILVNGTETLNEGTLNLSFDYVLNSAPEIINFNISLSQNIRINGSCSKTEFINYNVEGGGVPDGMMEQIKMKCIDALNNYETI